MNQILISINICGLMALVVICWFIWTAPPAPKMLYIPIESVILRRRVEITAQGGLSFFSGITGWDWKCQKPLGGPVVTTPINGLQDHGGELRTLVVY